MDATHLQHGQEVAEEPTQDPVLEEHHRQRHRHHHQALDAVTQHQVQDECMGHVAVQLGAHNVVAHEHIGHHPHQHQQAVLQHEQWVHGAHDGLQYGRTVVPRLVQVVLAHGEDGHCSQPVVVVRGRGGFVHGDVVHWDRRVSGRGVQEVLALVQRRVSVLSGIHISTVIVSHCSFFHS